MTKQIRLEQFKREILRRYPLISKDTLDLVMAALSRGYDEGWADGCAAGTNHTAKTLEFVNEALLSPRRPDESETQEFVREDTNR